MSHSRKDNEDCLVAIQELPVSSTDTVESWLSNLMAVTADPEDPEHEVPEP